MFVKTRDDLNALRAVMHRMTPSPREVDLMAPAAPPVVDERDDNVSHDGATGKS